MQIKQKILDLVTKIDDSPMPNAKIDEVEMADGYLILKNKPSAKVSIADLMKQNNLAEITEIHTSRPSDERRKYSTQAHGAQFVEVKVDEDLGIVKVTRVVEATAVGKIMNPKTSHSQKWAALFGNRNGFAGRNRD